MAFFKCKMCGGTIEFEQGATVGVCDSCGTKQTLPRLDDDRKANLYDRANHFRRNNEFDKAMGIYEQILNEDATDAEAYWSLVLCKYGIEYVEDPTTHRRVPTVNRAQYTSIFADEDYKSAIEHADGYQKDIYEAEAKTIDEIQKGILEISSKEEPFDVFICYKETDASGRRTPDSVLATELYHELTRDGFKVFFSRITLEDKLGQEYEPYIFAALNSAKVMVVLGTKAEHFNAVWVKNEWSRFLALIKNGERKVLIPAYKDMDPYDLPEEFSHLQAQDMSKLGFMQDLIRGIKKMVSADEQKPVVKETVINTGVANVAPLLKRAFMFLEDGEWDKADEFCEQVLNQDPENAEAYLGKLMAELKVHNQEQLADCAQPFDSSSNYQKAIRFGDEKLKASLEGFIKHIVDRNENNRLTEQYTAALNKLHTATDEKSYHIAASAFKTISGFKDADELYSQCVEKAETCRKDAIYDSSISKMENNSIEGYESAIKELKSISGWKDSDEQIALCQNRIEEIKAKEEADRLEAERQAEKERIEKEKKAKMRKKALIVIVALTAVCVAVAVLFTMVIIPNHQYKEAIEKYSTTLQNALVGDIIKFGEYEQDNDVSNGKEEIEWLVLAKEDSKILVISQYALDCQQYNTSVAYVTWKSCSLRKWINGSFLNSAFNLGEQRLIRKSTVTADMNPSYSTSPGANTYDKAFLLSVTEVYKYFGSDSTRQCSATAYAKAKGAYTATSNYHCWWWLRSPGNTSSVATYVNYLGSVNYNGFNVNYDYIAVRPAMWIDLGDLDG